MIKNNKKGFTLIELIISITIIGVITALVTVNFASTSKRARDSRRMADLEKIRLSLEMAKQVLGTYPASLSAIVPAYLQQTPVDPKNPASTYYYDPQPGFYKYFLYATMEDMGSTNIAPMAGCTTNCNYQVASP